MTQRLRALAELAETWASVNSQQPHGVSGQPVAPAPVTSLAVDDACTQHNKDIVL